MRNYATNIYDYVEQTTGCHVVKANTMYAGKTVSAYAKCDPSDTFDLELGTKIATKRLDHKIAKKRAATGRRKVQHYQELIDFCKQEIKRLTKAKAAAEIAVADRMVEVAEIEKELEALLTTEV